MSHAIRLTGHDHTTHHHGEVLTVKDEVIVRNSPANTVTMARARELVAAGRADWVGEPPLPERPAHRGGDPQEPPSDHDPHRDGGEEEAGEIT